MTPDGQTGRGAPDSGGGGRRRLEVLDGLRLLAALMVVLYHYTCRAPGTWGAPTAAMFRPLSGVTGYGFLGVELFFVISGFVICMSAWGRTLSGFAVSRVTRLYPAYWFAVLATAGLLALLHRPGLPRPGMIQVLVNLTMLQTPVRVTPVDPVYWTLWVELYFYLLFAVVVWRGLTYRRVVAFCAMWMVVSAGAMVVHRPLVTALVQANFSGCFVAGVTLYLMYRFRPTVLLWALLAASFALSLCGIHAAVLRAASEDGSGVTWPLAVVVMAAIYAVMTAVALGWLSWVRGAWLVTAGAFTYPLYLLHQEIGYIIIAWLHHRVSGWLLVPVLVALMLTAAWLVHRYVERPLAARMRRVIPRVLSRLGIGDSQGTRAEPADLYSDLR